MWNTFSETMPSLGMDIIVKMDDITKHVGKITLIQFLGNKWIGFNTDKMVGVAVAGKYQWKEI